jgi:hypothetical protein
MSTILTRIDEHHPRYEEAVKDAVPGRFLLDVKRNGKYKGRGVKQGFKEDLATTDGVNFNYYAHVAKLMTIRAMLFRHNRGSRRLAVKDVSTAFLQSNPYPDGRTKLIKFKSPITGVWMYFEQSGPIYGENAAPVYWETTIAPEIVALGFERGENERCVFKDPDDELTIGLYVDDMFMDGEEAKVEAFDQDIDVDHGGKFICKPIEFLTPETPIDFIGCIIMEDATHVYLSMEPYIQGMMIRFKDIIETLPKKEVVLPMSGPIDPESQPLSAALVKLFLEILGCCGWLSNTGRPDMTHAHSRIGQHTAKPTQSALDACVHALHYLRDNQDWCLRMPKNSEDVKLEDLFKPDFADPNNSGVDPDSFPDQHGWTFYADSDHAGNAEVQNKRRSQNGYCAAVDGGLVMWASKVTGVAFATPLIGESHPDMSSGSAEVYTTGNATLALLGMSYVMEEAGVPFPYPMMLQLDNKAAIAFCNDNANKTNLKHIDCRQEWCRTIRDKKVMRPIYVKSEDNWADFFTKILKPDIFIKLRNLMMHRKTCVMKEA